MTSFPPSRLFRFLLLAALVIPTALFCTVYLVSDEPVAIVSLPAPQVLGNTDPEPKPELDTLEVKGPTLAKALDLEAIQAKSFLVYDTDTGTTLARRNEKYPLPIASLTKLMTAYIAVQNLDLENTFFTITTADNIDVSPALNLRVGDRIKALDLFNAMLVGSANDAAQALGSHINERTGIPFKDFMNQAADYLGMDNTHFSNPMGFDSETNYSTATDLQLLVKATRKYPEFGTLSRRSAYSFKSELGNNYSIKTTNKLLATDPEISSIKTGFTDEAQGAMITEVDHNNHKFVIIVLGSQNRESDTLQLKKAILASYQWSE